MWRSWREQTWHKHKDVDSCRKNARAHDSKATSPKPPIRLELGLSVVLRLEPYIICSGAVCTQFGSSSNTIWEFLRLEIINAGTCRSWQRPGKTNDVGAMYGVYVLSSWSAVSMWPLYNMPCMCWRARSLSFLQTENFGNPQSSGRQPWC